MIQLRPRIPVVTVIDPAADLVSLQDAKAQCRVEHSEHDTLIAGYRDAAQAAIDGPSGWLGRSLGVQHLQLSVYDTEALRYDLPYPPVIAITAVKYADEDDAEQDLASGWVLDRGQAVFTSLPTVHELRIRYTAGFAAGGSPVSTAREILLARQAILLQIADWYYNRGDAGPTPGLSDAIKAMLGPIRVWAIA